MKKAAGMEQEKKRYMEEQLYQRIKNYTWERLVDVMLHEYRKEAWI